MKHIAIIILNYNDYINCINIIKNIRNINTDIKIILVDNNSSDNSFEVLKKYRNKKVDVIKTDKNGGYSYGNNFGIKYAIKKYNPKFIVISNPDVLFSKDAIVSMNKYLECNNEIIAVNTKIVDSYGRIQTSGWSIPTFSQDLISMFSISNFIQKKIEKINKSKNKEEFMINEVLSGCFFMIKTDKILEIGLFDERTFLYCEERILAEKIKLIDKLQGTILSSTCIHNHSQSINKNIKSNMKKFEILYNSRRIYYENYKKFPKFKLRIFDFFSKISLVEKYIIGLIK